MSLNRKTSTLWNLFTVEDNNNAKCNLCGQKMFYKSSTSNMKRHVTRKHPTVSLDYLVPLRDPENSAKINELNELDSTCSQSSTSKEVKKQYNMLNLK